MNDLLPNDLLPDEKLALEAMSIMASKNVGGMGGVDLEVQHQNDFHFLTAENTTYSINNRLSLEEINYWMGYQVDFDIMNDEFFYSREFETEVTLKNTQLAPEKLEDSSYREGIEDTVYYDSSEDPMLADLWANWDMAMGETLFDNFSGDCRPMNTTESWMEWNNRPLENNGFLENSLPGDAAGSWEVWEKEFNKQLLKDKMTKNAVARGASATQNGRKNVKRRANATRKRTNNVRRRAGDLTWTPSGGSRGKKQGEEMAKTAVEPRRKAPPRNKERTVLDWTPDVETAIRNIMIHTSDIIH